MLLLKPSVQAALTRKVLVTCQSGGVTPILPVPLRVHVAFYDSLPHPRLKPSMLISLTYSFWLHTCSTFSQKLNRNVIYYMKLLPLSHLPIERNVSPSEVTQHFIGTSFRILSACYHVPKCHFLNLRHSTTNFKISAKLSIM